MNVKALNNAALHEKCGQIAKFVALIVQPVYWWVYLNFCYRLRILIFASKYQNECDVSLLLLLALFFD